MKMDSDTWTRWMAALGATALLGTLPGIASAETRINKRTAAAPKGMVEISNTAGSVLVAGWERNEVEVTGELGDDVERLEFTKSGDVTRIKVVQPNHSSH